MHDASSHDESDADKLNLLLIGKLVIHILIMTIRWATISAQKNGSYHFSHHFKLNKYIYFTLNHVLTKQDLESQYLIGRSYDAL